MATYRENIVARINAIAAELAAMDQTKMGGLANTKTQDGGTTIDHVGYRKSLIDELRELRKALAEASEVEAGADSTEGGFEIRTQTDT